jgi:hypothetical protein
VSLVDVAAIRHRIKQKPSDLGWPPYAQLKSADPIEIANDERQLGFEFPPALKRLYVEIGNGGFGPGYGLIGLTNGVPDDQGKTGPDIYRLFRSDPELDWPNGLLPICHWGCAILSCVDCVDTNFRMQVFDPNVHEGDDWRDAFFEESISFEKWISDWTAGVDLWDQMYGDHGEISRILSVRRQMH